MKSRFLVTALALWPLASVAEIASFDCAGHAEDIGAITHSEALVRDASDDTCAIEIDGGTFLGFGFETSNISFQVAQGLSSTESEHAQVEFQMTGLDTQVGRFDVSASFTYDVETGRLTLQQLRAQRDDRSGVRLSGVFTLPSNIALEQAIAQFPRFQTKAFAVDIAVTPDLLAQIDGDLSDVTSAQISNALGDVSFSQVSRGSRRAFATFARATPQAYGTMEMNVTSQGAVNVAQFFLPLIGLPNRPDDTAIRQAVAAVLSGVELDVIWSAGRF